MDVLSFSIVTFDFQRAHPIFIVALSPPKISPIFLRQQFSRFSHDIQKKNTDTASFDKGKLSHGKPALVGGWGLNSSEKD